MAKGERMRELIVGFRSALDFWRSVRVAAGDRDAPDLGGRVFGARELSLSEQVDRAANLCNTTLPLDVIATDAAHRHSGERTCDHVWGGPLVRPRLIGLGDGVWVCDMATTFTQLALCMDEIELAQIGYEVAGTYGLTPWSDSDVTGGIKPLVNLAELRSYASSARATRIRGAAAACRALELVAPGSASPRESEVATMLTMTRARGGFSMGGFVMNEPIELPRDLGRLVGSSFIRPDFLWAGRKVAVEYESDAWHSSLGSVERDEGRRRVLEAMGYFVMRLTNDVLRSDVKLNAFMTSLAKRLDPRRPPASESMLTKRRALRARLFGPATVAEAALDVTAPYDGIIL